MLSYADYKINLRFYPHISQLFSLSLCILHCNQRLGEERINMYMLTCLSNQNHRCVYLMTDIHVPNLTFDFQLYIKYLTDLLYNFWPWNKISNLSDINLLMYIILHYSAYVVIQRKLMVDLCGNCECVTILLHWRLSHFDAGKNYC